MTEPDHAAALDLKRLSGDPPAQARQAAALLRPGLRRDLVDTALKVLAANPLAEARPALVQFYDHLSADGPKRDPGGFQRRAVLGALRPVATRDDLALLLRAVETVEFLPPGFKEEAIPVRVGGLLLLNEVDETLACYHAARLLVDAHTDAMSGEPALTAARVLASQAQVPLLYLYALGNATPRPPEVVAECLRGLTLLPRPLIAGVLAHFKDTRDPMVLLGLFDLLIRHQDGPQGMDFLIGALAARLDLDVFRYLVIALVLSRHVELIALVARAAEMEIDRERRAVLDEGLALLTPAVSTAPPHRRRRTAG
jgi:hypothetical protein